MIRICLREPDEHLREIGVKVLRDAFPEAQISSCATVDQCVTWAAANPGSVSCDYAGLAGFIGLANDVMDAKFDRISAEVEAVRHDLAGLRDITEENRLALNNGRKTFVRIRRILNGGADGRPGLSSRLQAVETQQKDVADDVMTIKRDIRWVVKLLIAAIIAAIMAMVLKVSPVAAALLDGPVRTALAEAYR